MYDDLINDYGLIKKNTNLATGVCCQLCQSFKLWQSFFSEPTRFDF
jgi:hypothetical protein